MPKSLKLERYSIGVGDRFARQARAQLQACLLAVAQGADVVPVWNKSNREHLIIGSEPASTRQAAEAAVKALGWHRPYHVDADHIRQETVDRFLPHSDFYTIDVADWIGKPAETQVVAAFTARHKELIGNVAIAGIDRVFHTTQGEIEAIGQKYFVATAEAGRIYRYIAERKAPGTFITEVSMDETDRPQTPLELLVILAALADERIPLQTVAPKFSGRFNKGVDYVGDVAQFEKEFTEDLAVIAHSIHKYGLPETLKLSVHSGSDKFSIYAPIRRGLARFNAGLHLKTAGTTWLEELIGLAESGGEGLILAQEIYGSSLEHIEELCGPYATVIDIDRRKLPTAAAVNQWTSEQYVSALRHDQKNPHYNPHVRQLLHVGYKIAAQQGQRYLDALTACEACVSRNVTSNLFERHLRPIFLSA
jgi:hypothetical protein